MPRTDKKAYAIVYKILGKPANMQKSTPRRYSGQESKKYNKQVSRAGYYDELVRIQPEIIDTRVGDTRVGDTGAVKR